MSSQRFAEPLYLQVKPSRLLAGFLVLAHAAAALALTYTDMPASGRILLSLMIAASLYHNLRVHVLLSASRSLLRLVWEASGKWRVWDAFGREHEARLRPGFFVNPKLVILNLQLKGMGRRAVLLLPDSLEDEALRRLRARLRTVRHDDSLKDDEN